MINKFIKSFIKNNKLFYISLVLCSSICLSSYLIFNNLYLSIRDGLYNYLSTSNYYDGYVITSNYLTEDDKNKLNNISNISDINYFSYHTYKININDEYRNIKLIIGDISKLKLYEYESDNDGTIYLSASFAKTNNLNSNSSLEINNHIFKIKSLINTPTIIGLNTNIIETSTTGVVYIDYKDAHNYFDINSNTFSYYLKDNTKDTLKEIENILGNNILYSENNDELKAKKEIDIDLEALKPVVTILPIILYIAGIIILILFIRQFMQNKTKEVCILKSLGINNKQIFILFILFSFCIAISSFIIGIILTIIESRIYLDFYTNASLLPRFKVIYSSKWLSSLVILFISNTIAIFVNSKYIYNVNVVTGIKNNISNKIRNKFISKHIMLKEFINIIKEKPARFIFLIINLICIIVVVSSSIGVKNAKDKSINYTFNYVNNYDYLAYYNESNDITNNSLYIKEFNITYDNKSFLEQVYVLNNLDYLNLENINHEKIVLKDGIYISNILANKLNIDIGDTIFIDNKSLKVTDIIYETTTSFSVISYDTYELLYDNKIYNAKFLNSNDDIKDTNIIYLYNNKVVKQDLINKYEYISNYIVIIIIFNLLLASIVIINISIIYFEERKKENYILRVQGISKEKIILYSLIELIVECLIALLIGLPLGNKLKIYVINEISNDNLYIGSFFNDINILLVILFVVLVSIISRVIIANKKIN